MAEPTYEELEEQANQMAGTLVAATTEIERLRAALMGLIDALHVATDDGPVLVGEAEAHAIEVLGSDKGP